MGKEATFFKKKTAGKQKEEERENPKILGREGSFSHSAIVAF